MANPIVLSFQQFHSIYRHCFGDLNDFDRLSIRDISSYEEIQKELPHLILASSEEQMITSIKKIRGALNASDKSTMSLLTQFKSYSEKVENSVAFWGCFDPKLPFDSNKNIQDLIIKRLKNVQENFKKVFSEKSMGVDKESLERCLSNSEFFEKKENLTETLRANSLAAKSKKIHHVAQFSPVENVEGFNIFSDKEIIKYRDDVIIRGMQTIRSSWINKALRGELVMESIMVPRSNGVPIKIELISLEKNQINYIKGYVTTLGALIYDQIQNNSIHSLKEAFHFAQGQLNNNLIFVSAYLTIGEVNLAFMKEQCLAGVNCYFKDHFEQDGMQKLDQDKKN